KIEIGAAIPETEGPATGEVAGRDTLTGLLRRATISAVDVQAAIRRPLALIVEAVKTILERTPPELSADVAEHGLMLAGGGALLRGFGELLRQETGLAVAVDDEPLTTVARGAGQALEDFEHFSPATRRTRRRRRR